MRTEIRESWGVVPPPGQPCQLVPEQLGAEVDPLPLEVTSAKARGSGPTDGVHPLAGRGLWAEVCTESADWPRLGGVWALPGAPSSALLCRQSTDSGSGAAAVTVGVPSSAWTGGWGWGAWWEERGGGGNTAQGPAQGGQRLGRPYPDDPVLPCPGLGGSCLSTHLWAVCPAEPGPSRGSSGPFHPPCTLGFRSLPLASLGSLDLVAWPPPAPLVSSVLCVCPTPRAEQPGGAVCLSRLSMSQVVPGCPWLAARTPPSPPRGRWTVPPSIRSLPTPEGPGPSPPTPGALAGWGWGAWVPLVLPESGA